MIWPDIWPFVLAAVLVQWHRKQLATRGLDSRRGGEAHDRACRCEACDPVFSPWVDRWVRIA